MVVEGHGRPAKKSEGREKEREKGRERGKKGKEDGGGGCITGDIWAMTPPSCG